MDTVIFQQYVKKLIRMFVQIIIIYLRVLVIKQQIAYGLIQILRNKNVNIIVQKYIKRVSAKRNYFKQLLQIKQQIKQTMKNWIFNANGVLHLKILKKINKFQINVKILRLIVKINIRILLLV